MSYAYTSDNLLKGTSDGTTLLYDPADRLVEYDTTMSTRFVYDGGEIAAEVDGAGNLLRRYVTGAGADEPLVWYEGAGTGDKRWLIPDERGSIIAVTNASGQQLAINSYDDYGIPASTNLGRFQYTGQAWLPELGLYYYKARMYSATLGRFLQTDPIGYGDGPNWYNYAHGDPVNGRDSSGLAGSPPLEDQENFNNDGGGSGEPPEADGPGQCATRFSIGGSTLGYSLPHPCDGGFTGIDGPTSGAAGNAAERADAPQKTQEIIVRASWHTRDFVGHYYYGLGTPVNLGDVGLGDRFRGAPSVVAAVNRYKASILAKARSGFNDVSKTVTDVTNVADLFSVGHSTFFEAAQCYSGSCVFAFGIRDWFSDPLGKGIEVGIPYRINYGWTEIVGY